MGTVVLVSKYNVRFVLKDGNKNILKKAAALKEEEKTISRFFHDDFNRENELNFHCLQFRLLI